MIASERQASVTPVFAFQPQSRVRALINRGLAHVASYVADLVVREKMGRMSPRLLKDIGLSKEALDAHRPASSFDPNDIARRRLG